MLLALLGLLWVLEFDQSVFSVFEQDFDANHVAV